MRTLITLLASITVICLLMVGCGERRTDCKYRQGDIVESVVSGGRGQVVYTYTNGNCRYDVRFPDYMKPYQHMREFEIRKVEAI